MRLLRKQMPHGEMPVDRVAGFPFGGAGAGIDRLVEELPVEPGIDIVGIDFG